MALSITREGRSILMELWRAELSARRPSGYSDLDALTDVHALGPATFDEALDVVEKPEDCSDENCWRHGGKGPCTCGGDDDDDGTTTGGW